MTLVIIAAIAAIVTIITIASHNIRKQRMVSAIERRMATELCALKNVRQKFALLGNQAELQGIRYALYQLEWSLQDNLDQMARDLDEVLGL